MIASVAEFVRYFEGVRRRTWVAVDRVTPALLDWKPRPDEFTCGDIVRHLAGAERFFVRLIHDVAFFETGFGGLQTGRIFGEGKIAHEMTLAGDVAKIVVEAAQAGVFPIDDFENRGEPVLF